MPSGLNLRKQSFRDENTTSSFKGIYTKPSSIGSHKWKIKYDKLFYIGREIGLFKKTNTTLYYRVPTTLSASIKEYFHYNTDVFNVSQLSRSSLQINILQTASLTVSNLPIPSRSFPPTQKIKGLNRRSSVMLQVRERKNLFSQRKIILEMSNN